MKHSEEIILNLLRIRRAQAMSEQAGMSSDDVETLRSFILQARRKIPSFALAHFDRLEASGKLGAAEVSPEGVCPVCGTKMPDDELDYVLNGGGIGVCDGCYAFLYPHSDLFKEDDFLTRLLSK